MNPKVLNASQIKRFIPKRPSTSQKGNNGHLLIVAGSRGMTGAAYLCALGALKAGAGLVTVAGPSTVRRVIGSRLPEAMMIPLSAAEIKKYVRRRTITTLAIGPGLSVHPSIRRVIKALLHLGLPVVLDADGLNNIKPVDIKSKPIVITPHPGELARLLGKSVREIQADRVRVAIGTAKRLGLICVLKGHRTVISDGWKSYLNPTGNQAMATGGMGDVLTGVIGALLAQDLSLFDAASAGVYLHGLAGDIAKISDRGLLATELANTIPKALKKMGIR